MNSNRFEHHTLYGGLNGSSMSWRLEDYFAVDGECNELLYAMTGYYGDTFDPSFDVDKLSRPAYLSQPEWGPRVHELLQISALFKKLQDDARAMQITCNVHISQMGELICKYLECTYLKDLNEIEESPRMNLSSFNIMLEYKQRLTSIMDLLKEMKDNNECFIHSKLRELLSFKVDLSTFPVQTDIFIQMSSEYMLTGTIHNLSRPTFFINDLGGEESTIDYTKWPKGVNPKNALVILETGKFVKKLRSLGINKDLNPYEIFGDAVKNNAKLYEIPVLFDEFFKDAQEKIRRRYLEDFNSETLLEILHNFHLFSLHRHEYFWYNLLDQRASYLKHNEEKPSTIGKVFHNTLYQTYGFEQGDAFINEIDLLASNEPSNQLLLMKLRFQHSPVVELWLERSHKDKYRKVFVYLTKLLQTRYALMKAWETNRKDRNMADKMFLLSWCLKTLGCFYNYSRLQIEHRLAAFTKSCSTVQDVEATSQLLESALSQLLKDLFLESGARSKLINDIVGFAWKVMSSLDKQPEVGPEMREHFSCIRRALTSIFEENYQYRLAYPFPELLRFY